MFVYFPSQFQISIPNCTLKKQTSSQQKQIVICLSIQNSIRSQHTIHSCCIIIPHNLSTHFTEYELLLKLDVMQSKSRYIFHVAHAGTMVYLHFYIFFISNNIFVCYSSELVRLHSLFNNFGGQLR